MDRLGWQGHLSHFEQVPQHWLCLEGLPGHPVLAHGETVLLWHNHLLQMHVRFYLRLLHMKRLHRACAPGTSHTAHLVVRVEGKQTRTVSGSFDSIECIHSKASREVNAPSMVARLSPRLHACLRCGMARQGEPDV